MSAIRNSERRPECNKRARDRRPRPRPVCKAPSAGGRGPRPRPPAGARCGSEICFDTVDLFATTVRIGRTGQARSGQWKRWIGSLVVYKFRSNNYPKFYSVVSVLKFTALGQSRLEADSDCCLWDHYVRYRQLNVLFEKRRAGSSPLFCAFAVKESDSRHHFETKKITGPEIGSPAALPGRPEVTADETNASAMPLVGLNAEQCVQRLQLAFNNEALSQATVFQWFREFPNGRYSFQDEMRQGLLQQPPHLMSRLFVK
ncbi:hypothetical protein EVAR_28222_1 [Eumeta japonica]|uniref:Mos1 transposase HTH domain-containing protein n=1 Tax=Eumeta variegata TaxID=151549 RepID=A0A4C1V631_EUMVA|nr:hypothetical protein EVAR_28222_1 [Eumeta japonica]